MTEALDTATAITAAGVLDQVRSSRQSVLVEEAHQLRLACDWADLHPAESIDDACCYGDSPVPVAGEGAPLVTEFCIAELAAALRLPTELGKALIGEALELRHRLPRVWRRVMALELPAWRARRIARKTIHLSRAAAAFVDAQIAHLAHTITPAATDRLVDEAMAQFMPAEAEKERELALDRRRFTVDHRQVSFAGTSRIDGEVDLADALDIDAAVKERVKKLRDAGATEAPDVLRARAIAEICRHDLTLDLTLDHETGAAGEGTHAGEVVVHLHLSEDDDTTGYVANTKSLVTVAQVKQWLARSARVTVKPVVDLDAHRFVAGYQVPDSLKEQVDLRDGACVFPWCGRSAARCDHDHVVPHDQGGPTCSCNLAPLCRRHHRLKTHGSWVYTMIDPGTILWTSPHGYQFLRDTIGTHDISRDRRPPPDG